MQIIRSYLRAGTLIIIALFLATTAFGQTSVVTYQGKLDESSTPASGTYEMRFTLYDAFVGGTQQPQPGPITLDFTVANGNAIPVVNGIFTVPLDFTAAAFSGGDRFLDISVRHNNLEPFTPLSPRKLLSSIPYAVRSVTATNNVLKTGDTMSGPLNMSNQKITGVATPTLAGDAANKSYVDATVTPNSFQVSWNSQFGMAAGSWATIPASSTTFTTTGKPLFITMNLAFKEGSSAGCRPVIDGAWAGSYGGLIGGGDPFWQEGLTFLGGGNWQRWNLARIYPGVPAGSHTFAIQCVTDAGTLQVCGAGGVIGCSWGAFEIH